MQKLLWSVTALVTVLVGAVLLLPRLIDWNDYRAEIAAAAERATGRPVRIEGDVSLLLLPTPTLSAARVRIGDAPGSAAATASLEIKALDARFAFLPLLLGRVEIDSVALIEPQLTLRRDAAGKTGWSARDSERLDAIAFTRLIIVGGSIDWGGAHPDRVTQINAELVAQPSQTGARTSWRVAADAHFHELVWQASVSVGEGGGSSRALSASLALRGGAALLRLAGAVTGEDWQAARVSGRLTGEAARLPVLLQLLDLRAPLPLTEKAVLEAKLEGGADGWRLAELAVSVGDLRLSGDVALALGAAPAFRAKLAANRLDLARWLELAPIGAEAVVTPVATLASGMLPDGELDLGVDAIFWRDGLMRAARLQAASADGTITVKQLTAQLPGGSDVSLFGRLAPGWQFSGRMEAGSDNLRALLGWLAIDITALPPDRLRRIAVTAALAAAPDRLELSDLDLSFDSSKLTGELALALGDRLGISANLTLDRGNLDAYLPREFPVPDVRWRESTDLALRLHAGQLSWQALAMGKAALAVTLHDGIFDTAGSVDDFAGGRLQFSGAWRRGSADDGQLEASLRVAVPEAERLAPLFAADLALPPLGPADLKLALRGLPGRPVAQLTGSIAGATLDAEGVAALDGTPASINLGLDHPSALALLQRFLPAYLPSGAVQGPLALAAHLAWQQGVVSLDDITARVGPTNLVGKLSLDLAPARPHLVASLAASTLDLELLAPIAAITAWPERLDADFGLRFGAIDAGSLAFSDIATSGALHGGRLAIADLSGRWLGGTLTGSAQGELGAAGTLAIDFRLADGDLAEASAWLIGDPGAAGRFDLAAKLAGRGGDLAARLVRLAGSGSLRLGPSTLEGVDLAAVAALLRQPGPSGLLLPEVSAAFAQGRTVLTSATGQVTLENGSISRIDGRIELAPPVTPALIAVALDKVRDSIEFELPGEKAKWRLRIAGALAARGGAGRSYGLAPIASP